MKLISAFFMWLIVSSGFVRIENQKAGEEKKKVLIPANQDQDLPDGTYYIRCVAGAQKYLDVSWSTKDDASGKVQLWSLGNSTSNNKWIVKSEGIPFVGGYTIKAKVNNKYLTAIGEDNGDSPAVDARYSAGWFKERQEWKIKKVDVAGNGDLIYKVYCRGNGKFLDAKNDCVSQNGCKVQMWNDGNDMTREWFFVKTN